MGLGKKHPAPSSWDKNQLLEKRQVRYQAVLLGGEPVVRLAVGDTITMDYIKNI